MPKQTPTLAKLLTMVVLRALVLRAAAVPVAVVRRPDPAQAEGLPRAGRVPGGHDAGRAGRRADRRRQRRQGRPQGPRQAAATARSRRSSSTAPTRRSPATRSAMLRQKTLLGETYVELSPAALGPQARGGRPAAGRAGHARPSSSTRSSTRWTRRRATRSAPGSRSSAAAIEGHGRDVNAALGTLPGFAADADDVLRRARLPGGRRAAAGQEHRRDVRRAHRERGSSCAA